MKADYYFAYGSNLNCHAWQDWCLRQGIDPLILDFGSGQVARLGNYRLAFNKRSSIWGGGVLDIIPCSGGLVEGVLFPASEPLFRVLDIKEGVSFNSRHYERSLVTPIDAAGNEFRAVTYQVHLAARHSSGHLPPSQAYLDVVKEGYNFWSLDIGPLQLAAEGPLVA